MKIFVILAVVSIATAQLAHHRPIQVQLTDANNRVVQVQTPTIEIIHRQPNFDESPSDWPQFQSGQGLPDFPTWNWQNEMPIRRFPEIFEIVDQPQPPFPFPMPIRPDSRFPWEMQPEPAPEPELEAVPRWGNNPRWGVQRPEPEPEPEPEQPSWNIPRWNIQPEQPSWNIPRWNLQPEPEPEQEWHIPRLPPWAMPQPDPEPEQPSWNIPRWNQRPEPEPLPPARPQWPVQRPEPQPVPPQFPQFPQFPHFPQPEPEPLPPQRPQWPIQRPSPPEPELVFPPVERPVWPIFPQPPMREPQPPRASWRDGYPDDRCPNPDIHDGYPVFLPGRGQWSFFICWGGIAWPFECPEGTIFRSEVNVCADPAWVPTIQIQPYLTEEVDGAVPYEAE